MLTVLYIKSLTFTTYFLLKKLKDISGHLFLKNNLCAWTLHRSTLSAHLQKCRQARYLIYFTLDNIHLCKLNLDTSKFLPKKKSFETTTHAGSFPTVWRNVRRKCLNSNATVSQRNKRQVQPLTMGYHRKWRVPHPGTTNLHINAPLTHM